MPLPTDLEIEITNDEIVEYYECENQRREQSWLSSAIMAGLGVLQIIAYGDLYQKALDWRKEVNDALLACATKEHCFWMQESFPYMKEAFDVVCSMPEVVPAYGDNLPAKYYAVEDCLTEWLQEEDSDHCGSCIDPCHQHLSVAMAMGVTGAYSQLRRTEELIALRRSEMKAQAMARISHAGQHTAAPGRQAQALSLNLANTLVAIASSGINTGLSTLGSGLAGLSNSGIGGGA